MPIYSIQAPNGKTYSIEGPVGATQDDVIAEVMRRDPSAGQSPSKERTFTEAAKDIGAGIVGGVGSLVQLPGQLYGLATGDFSKTGALGTGEEISKYAEEMKSAGLKAREAERAQKIQSAEEKGQWEAAKTAFGETIKDPGLLLNFLAEQAPQLLVPFGAAKVAKGLTAAEAAASAATKAAVGAGAVQQGADVGAGAYEDIYKELKRKGATDQDAAAGALNLARAAGASAAIISLLAQRLPGAKTLEESFAGVPGTGGRLLGAGKGALGESFSEVAEETGGKFTSNLAMRDVKPEQELTAGLGQAAGMAAIGGVGMGGVGGAMQRTAAAPGKETPPAQPAPSTAPAAEGVAPESLAPLTPQEKQELARQQLQAQPVEDVLGGIREQIKTATPTTAEDVARIRNEHEDAVLSDLMAQDEEMKASQEAAQLQLEAAQNEARRHLEMDSSTEFQDEAIKQASERIRESRLLSRVQSLIDQNIPFASTAINDINQKFGVINEAPLTEPERARVQNIMGMAQAFTNFVNLPTVAAPIQDRFAQNQALEQLIKEKKDAADTLRAAPVAPSNVIPQAPVSEGAIEGESVRPEGGFDLGAEEDRKGRRLKAKDLSKLLADQITAEPTGLEGEAPIIPEVEEYRSKIGEIRTAQKGVKSINLLTAIKGKISQAEVRDIAPGKISTTLGSPTGGSVSDLVDSGLLDNFLPPNMQPSSAQYDSAESTEYIKEKLRNKNHLSFDAEMEIAGMDYTISQLESEIAELLEIEDVNKLIAQTQAELAQEAEAAISERPTEPAAPSAGQASEEVRRRLSEEDELNKWFGNSQVVGHDGRPLPVYHTTFGVMDEAITKFDRDYMVRNKRRAPSIDNIGTWFSDSAKRSADYGAGAQYPSYLKITKPMVYKSFADLRSDWNKFHQTGAASDAGKNLHNKQNTFFGDSNGFVSYLKKKGYDGILILPHKSETSNEFVDQAGYITFEPEQVRSVFDLKEARPELELKPTTPEGLRLKALQEKVQPEAPEGELVLTGSERAVDEARARGQMELGGEGDIRYSRQQHTETPAFKKWFGDSKVVDENGEPLVVYHGTTADFDTFNEGAPRNVGFTKDAKGFYFSADSDAASGYATYPMLTRGREGGNVMPVYLSIKNPLRLESGSAQHTIITPAELASYETQGYDGIIVGDFEEVVAFHPNQIKSATGNIGTYDPTNPDIRYRSGAVTGKSIGADQTQSIVDAISSRWDNAPEVVVAKDMNDTAIPEAVRKHNQQQLARGAKGSPKGFFYKGKAYIIADSMTSANDVMETLFHESLGHYGLRGTFGAEMNKVLSDLVKNRKKEVEAKAEQYGLDPKNEAEMLEAAEEVLAEMAQTKPGLPFVKRAIAAIRNFFRSIGFSVKMSDNDIIQKYILPARAFVEKGERRAAEGKPAAMREPAKAPPTESAAFKKWFGDSKVVDEDGEPLVVSHITKKKGITTFDPKYKTELSSMGFHFGTPEQAEFRGTQYDFKSRGEPEVGQYYLSIKKPLRVSHMASYAPDHLADQMVEMGVLDDDSYADIQSETGYDSVETGDRLVQILKDNGYDGLVYENEKEGAGDSYVPFDPAQIKSATENVGTYDPDNADIRYQRQGPAQDSIDILEKLGRTEGPEPTLAQQIKALANDTRDNPKRTAATAAAATNEWVRKTVNKVLSADAAIQDDYQKYVRETTEDAGVAMKKMIESSLSQTYHANAVAGTFLEYGSLDYSEKAHKWEAKKDGNNFIKLVSKVNAMADRLGITHEVAQEIAHRAAEAKRLRGWMKYNDSVVEKVEELRAEADRIERKSPVAASELRDKATRELGKRKTIHMTPEQIALGEQLFDLHPELKEISDIWNGIRKNASDVMIKSGLWSQEEADELLSNMDYVPFYREMDEGDGSPKTHYNKLKVDAKEKRATGSYRPVNNIIDNQFAWVQHAISRAVKNKSAVALADAAIEMEAAKQVQKPGKPSPKSKLPVATHKENVTRVWKNGEEQYYEMDDPLYVDAFNGLESVAIPGLKWAKKLADTLRSSVVMYPMFTVAQLPQDAFAAMFSSGLNPRFALKIPVLAVKEFVQTFRNASTTHEHLKKFGAVGVRDYAAAEIRIDAEVMAGLKGRKGFWPKVADKLHHFAMSGENAVRQAVYIAAKEQGLSEAEAIEKTFEIFNARRRGTSKSLAIASQVIPFFNAYLAAQNVAYKALTGKGSSPTTKKAAYETLLKTSASVFALSFIYSMMAADDEDYLKKNASIRDRMFVVPGTGGMGIPIRTDMFALPKVLAEHIYLTVTDKGYEDPKKFRQAMWSTLVESVLSPTPVPAAIKPAVEIAMNYNFLQKRPLVGTYLQDKETERQFTESTSELAKIMGQSGLASPIAIDHFIRGMFGSFGGLTLYATNFLISAGSDVERPELSVQDMLATLPGTSGFISKEYENGLKRDFYELRDVVDKAANTMKDIKTRSPEKLEEYLSDEETMTRIGMQKGVAKISEQLTKIRKAISFVSNTTEMTSSEKKERIKELRDAEMEMLQGLDVKGMRQMAMM